MGYSKTLEVGSSYLASAVLLAENNPFKTLNNTLTYTKMKEIIFVREIYNTATLRIGFEIGSASATIYGRICLNGIAAGTERSHVGAGFTAFTEDVTFTTIKAGDRIQIYCKLSNSPGSGDVRNFTISGTETPFYNSMV